MQAGLRVGIADMTKAERSTRGNPERRQREAAAATNILGIHERFNLGLPDTEVGSEIRHRDPIIETIRHTRPRIVLAPYWEDRHPDHAATGRLVKDACFLAGVAKVGVEEPHRAQHLYHYMLHHPFAPTFVSDISKVWEQKATAIRAFGSQFDPNADEPHTVLSRPGFLRHNEAKAVHFGAMIGAAYGEPFYCQGPVAMQPFTGIEQAPSAPDYSTYAP